MIRIGISPGFIYPDASRTFFAQKTLSFIENDLARYFARLNLFPTLLLDVSEEILESYIKEMSGIVLQGGSDISSESYGEESIDLEKWPGDAVRDRYELKVIDIAIKNKIPIFGICRGCQLINVYFGGTLYQDIATQKKESILHRNADLYDRLAHEVDITSSGFLSSCYPKEKKLIVNSIHHQGIKKLGEGLVAEAICPDDGAVEAIACLKSAVFGVQWHPEFSYTLKGEVADATALLNGFLSYCYK